MSLELYISTKVSNPEKATSLLDGQQTTLDEWINFCFSHFISPLSSMQHYAHAVKYFDATVAVAVNNFSSLGKHLNT